MSDLNFQDYSEGRDPVKEALKMQVDDLPRSSWLDVVNKMIYDQFTGEGKSRNEFPAIVRGIVSYGKTEGFQSSESGVDFSEYLSNTDPFYSSIEDTQRIQNGGVVKDFKDKKILFLETPFFYYPSDAHLGDYMWLNSMLRMDITNTKAKRDFVPDEMIYITFNSIPNLSGPKFVRFPVEDKKMIYPSEKKRRSVKQKHLDATADLVADKFK